MPAVRLHLLLVLAWIAVPSPAFASDAEVRHQIARILVEEKLTGAVWSTLAADGSIETGAAGVRDARTGAALAADDRVHVGSVAKTLLATGVLRLVTEERLALDNPVHEVLPGVVFDNPWAATDPVRIRHLLDHTAGIDDLRLWQFFSRDAHPDTPLADAFPDDKGLLRVRSRPGSRFSYSNMGYALLGRVVEQVVGERYERYLDAHLLAPLGMSDSTFAFVSQEGRYADPRLAMGHLDDARAHPAVPTYVRPGAQFTTTAGDMARFAAFLMGDGRIDGRRFIAPHLLRAMGEPMGTEAARAGLRVGYGLGLATRDRHGVVGRCHEGSVVGYRAMLCLFPAQRRAFFVAINTDSETADHGRLYAALANELRIPRSTVPARSITAGDDAGWTGFYVPSPGRFSRYQWLDTVLGFLHLHRQDDALLLRGLQSDPRLLEPVGKNLFRAPDRTQASHALLNAGDGARILTTGTQSFERVPVWRLLILWASLAAGVVGMAYLLLSGLVRLLRRRMGPAHAAFLPVLAVLALILPVPLFLSQTFLDLGDVTPASVLLLVVTTTLPLAMIAGLVRQARHRARERWAVCDALAMLAVLQFTLVLGAWGLLPLRLWA